MSKEILIFLKKFIHSPNTVGSVVPSSNHLSAALARVISEQQEVERIIEIGAGTGTITKALLDASPTLVEIDLDFCKLLKQKYPNLNVVNQCGAQYLLKCQEQVGLVLSVPLTTSPRRQALVNAIGELRSRGKLAWCVLYTYTLGNPLQAVNFLYACKQTRVWKNIPPATVWLYQ